ncbi:MAG: hypothetical protein IIA61_08705 [Candidatus Marinimicrobia bacterium]|nr:hypothetical protein [Candidatus Neomarinimicrobiota bacterium]
MKNITKIKYNIIILTFLMSILTQKGITQNFLIDNQNFFITPNTTVYKLNNTFDYYINASRFILSQEISEPNIMLKNLPVRSLYQRQNKVNNNVLHSDSLQQPLPDIIYGNNLMNKHKTNNEPGDLDLGLMMPLKEKRIFLSGKKRKITMISFGVLTVTSAYIAQKYMSKADVSYNRYLNAGTPEKMNKYFQQTEKYDHIAGYGLISFQVNFLFTVYSIIRALPK